MKIERKFSEEGVYFYHFYSTDLEFLARETRQEKEVKLPEFANDILLHIEK